MNRYALYSNARIMAMVPFLGFAGHIWRADYSGCKNYHFRFGSLDLSSFLSSSTLFSPTMQTSLRHKISLLSVMSSHGLFVSTGVHRHAAKMWTSVFECERKGNTGFSFFIVQIYTKSTFIYLNWTTRIFKKKKKDLKRRGAIWNGQVDWSWCAWIC